MASIFRHSAYYQLDQEVDLQYNSANTQAMFSKCAQFNIKEHMSIQYFDFAFSSEGKEAKSRGMQIQTGCGETKERSLFYVKSSRNFVGDYEISFEKSFMNQHETVFQRGLKNYMEHLQNLLIFKKSNHFPQFETQFKNQQDKKTCSELIGLLKIKTKKEVTENILTMVREFQKIKAFFQMISSHCSEKITLQLMAIAQRVFQQHKANGDQFMSPFELIQIVDSVETKSADISILNLAFLDGKLSQQIMSSEEYKKFMKIYCSTVILVLSQYFENPYYERDDQKILKRPSSFFSDDSFNLQNDEEDKIEVFPIKKRKKSL